MAYANRGEKITAAAINTQNKSGDTNNGEYWSSNEWWGGKSYWKGQTVHGDIVVANKKHPKEGGWQYFPNSDGCYIYDPSGAAAWYKAYYDASCWSNGGDAEISLEQKINGKWTRIFWNKWQNHWGNHYSGGLMSELSSWENSSSWQNGGGHKISGTITEGWVRAASWAENSYCAGHTQCGISPFKFTCKAGEYLRMTPSPIASVNGPNRYACRGKILSVDGSQANSVNIHNPPGLLITDGKPGAGAVPTRALMSSYSVSSTRSLGAVDDRIETSKPKAIIKNSEGETVFQENISSYSLLEENTLTIDLIWGPNPDAENLQRKKIYTINILLNDNIIESFKCEFEGYLYTETFDENGKLYIKTNYIRMHIMQ